MLFDLLRNTPGSTPFQTPLGLDGEGIPVWLDLHDPASRHVVLEGGTRAGRGEMLRALVIGLALTTRPALIQMLAIDASGRELTVVDMLPHAVAETASDPGAAQTNLLWLAAELEDRAAQGRLWPEMLLILEDIAGLARSESGRGRSALTAILRSGGPWGIHVVGGVETTASGLKEAGWRRPEVARLIAGEPDGSFEYVRGGRRTCLAGARVAAADLDGVARGTRPAGVAGGPRSSLVAGRRAGWRQPA